MLAGQCMGRGSEGSRPPRRAGRPVSGCLVAGPLPGLITMKQPYFMNIVLSCLFYISDSSWKARGGGRRAWEDRRGAHTLQPLVFRLKMKLQNHTFNMLFVCAWGWKEGEWEGGAVQVLFSGDVTARLAGWTRTNHRSLCLACVAMLGMLKVASPLSFLPPSLSSPPPPPHHVNSLLQ